MREMYATASVISVAAKKMIPDVPEGSVYSTAKPIVVSPSFVDSYEGLHLKHIPSQRIIQIVVTSRSIPLLH